MASRNRRTNETPRRATATRSADGKRIVIPLEPDYDETQVTRIKHSVTVTRDNITEKTSVEVPKLPANATRMQTLAFVEKFEHAVETMSWTTGAKKFENFKKHLEGIQDAKWNIVVQGRARTNAEFEEALDEFLKTTFDEYNDYDDQIEYLRSIRKPSYMDPMTFQQNLTVANELLKQIPGAPDVDPGLDEEELKRIYMKSMPVAWRKKYKDAGKQTRNEDLNEIRTYFEGQAAEDPYVPRSQRHQSSNRSNQGNNRNRRTQGYRGNNNDNRNRQNYRNDRNSNRGYNQYGNQSNYGNNNNQGNYRSNYQRNNNYNRYNNNNNGNERSNNDNRQGGNQRYNTRHRFANDNNGNNRYGNRQGDSHHNDAASGQNTAQGSNEQNSNNTEDNYFIEDYDVENVAQEYHEETDDLEDSYYLHTDDPEDVNFENNELQDGVPTTLATAKAVNHKKGNHLFKCLLDSGGTYVMVHRSALPKNVTIHEDPQKIQFSTTQGAFKPLGVVWIKNLSLPEFGHTRKISKIKAYVFDSPSPRYTLILGRNFLRMTNIQLDFGNNTTTWYDKTVPFHPANYWTDNHAVRQALTVNPFRVNTAQSFYDMVGPLTAAKYEKVHVATVTQQQKHLTPEQRESLRKVLAQCTELFSGRIGKYEGRRFKIQLKEGITPYHCTQPYSIPQSELAVTKEEIDRQCKIGLLVPCYDTEWGMPMFTRKKKDGTIRTVDDLRMLNKAIRRVQYPLPKIQNIFHRRRGYKFMTKIDISMQYYTMYLDEDSTWYCVLVTPFGKYRRTVLPMGLVNSPSWAQATMEEIFQDMKNKIEIYIDDIAIFSETYEDHMQTIHTVLTRLQAAGFTVNPLKCEWAVKETDFLGFWMTPTGLRPWQKKVDAIHNLAVPKTLKQLRSFIGLVNFYRLFWKSRAHIMAPLTALTKVERKDFAKSWTQQHTDAFNAVKRMVCQEVLLAYPDPNIPYVIDTDASDTQLGAVITQNGNPVAFYSRKLTGAQSRYPIPDKEALSIVETLTEFRSILLGADVKVRTDHLNLTRTDIKSQRLLNWRLLIEDFAPTLTYIPGDSNKAADFLSRYPIQLGEKQSCPALDRRVKHHRRMPPEFQTPESLLYYPDDVAAFPLTFQNIQDEQQADALLLLKVNEPGYDTRDYHGHQLIVKTTNNQNPKIVIPESIIDDTIKWFHYTCGHSGELRLYQSINSMYYYRGLKDKVHHFVQSCDSCQRNKRPQIQYGETPATEADIAPFEVVAVDLVGPWPFDIPGIGKITINALTIIDQASTLPELTRLDDETGAHVVMKFENEWLARYPRPLFCIHDPGPQFISRAFQECLNRNGITPRPTTVKNPQANAIVERMHSTAGDILRSMINEAPPQNMAQAIDIVDTALANTQYAIRASIHRTLSISPGAMVFHRDMLQPVPLLVDLQQLRQKRQAVIDYNNMRENRRRQHHDYQPGQEILLLTYEPRKMEPRATGPFTIQTVHVNGTVTIQRGPNMTERLNIRRIKPYYRP